MFVEPNEDSFAPRPRRYDAEGPSTQREVIQAGIDAEVIETDWWGYSARVENEVYGEILGAVTTVFSEQQIREHFQAQGLGEMMPSPSLLRTDPEVRRALLGLAETADGSILQGLPTDWRDIRQVARDRMRLEWEEAQQILGAGPSYSGVSEFIGRSGVAMTDPVSLAMIPFGGGSGSLGRLVLREAALGALGEAAIIPRMQDVARELDIPAPNVAQQIAMGAAFGGALAGGIGALTRGVEYARLRNEVIAPPPGVPAAQAMEAVHEAEQALRVGGPVPPAPVPADIPPVTLRPGEPVYELPEITFDIDAPPIDAAPESGIPAGLLPDRPSTIEVDDAIRRIREDNPQLARARPTWDDLLNRGGIQWRRTNPNTGESELTPIASELQGIGVSNRQLVGLIRRNGMAEVDNIPATEFADGGTPRLRTSDDGLYIDRDALIEAIVQEAGGSPAYRTLEAEYAAQQIADLEDELVVIRRDLDAAAAALDEVPEMDFSGPYMPTPRQQPDMDGLARAQEAERLMGAYAANTNISGDVQSRAMAHLADFGGSVEDAVVRAMVDAEQEEFYEAIGASAARGSEAVSVDPAAAAAARPDATTAQDAGGSRAIPGGDGRSSEPTAAGDQLLIDGVAPVSQRDRMQAAQASPMRGGNAAPDMGMFDEGARRQQDMFDDPTTPEAATYMDDWERSIRDEIDAYGDVSVDVEGGTVSAQRLLDDMQADADHLAAINACTARGRGTA